MIDMEYLQRPKPEWARGVGHTTDGIHSAFQLMDVHGGVYYLVERMVESNHVRSIVWQFADFWNLSFFQIRPHTFDLSGKRFIIVALNGYEERTRASPYPIVIDHWAKVVGECQHCGEITGSTLNRICRRCGYLHNPDTRNTEVDPETQMIYRQDNLCSVLGLHNWKEDGF